MASRRAFAIRGFSMSWSCHFQRQAAPLIFFCSTTDFPLFEEHGFDRAYGLRALEANTIDPTRQMVGMENGPIGTWSRPSVVQDGRDPPGAVVDLEGYFGRFRDRVAQGRGGVERI